VRTALATRNVQQFSGLRLGYADRCAVLTVTGRASLCSGGLCKHAVDITAASRGMNAQASPPPPSRLSRRSASANMTRRKQYTHNIENGSLAGIGVCCLANIQRRAQHVHQAGRRPAVTKDVWPRPSREHGVYGQALLIVPCDCCKQRYGALCHLLPRRGFASRMGYLFAKVIIGLDWGLDENCEPIGIGHCSPR
jgi:hypothetical protein